MSPQELSCPTTAGPEKSDTAHDRECPSVYTFLLLADEQNTDWLVARQEVQVEPPDEGNSGERMEERS